MNAVSDRIANLPPEKRRWLESRLKNSREESKTPPLTRREPAEFFPLSFAQQRLWFLDQLDPGSAVYNIPGAIHFRGSLDTDALERTLNEITRRHEILRTSFPSINGAPVQKIAPHLTINLPLVDLQKLSKDEQEAEIRRRALLEADNPFDLARGPLLRVGLLRLKEQEHLLLVTKHHIISDAWSMNVFIREVESVYQAFSRRQRSPLPELPVQYADFAVWQQRYWSAERLDAQLQYWRRHLAGSLPVLSLPTSRSRPAIQTLRGWKRPFSLAPSVSDSIKVLSRCQGVTVFTVLLAAFQILLYSYSGQEDIVVGTDVANRNRSELEGLIGLFVNQLVLRANLSGNPTFQELLARTHEVVIAGFANQDLPFEKLVQALNPARDRSRTPLFQAKVVFWKNPSQQQPHQVPDLIPSAREFDRRTAKFDLTLFLIDYGENLFGSLEYNTDLFDAATIEHMTGRFQTILEAIIANPQARLKSLSLLTENERKRLSMEQAERDNVNRRRFMQARSKAVSLPEGNLVRISCGFGGALPLLIEPEVTGLDLVDWARGNIELIEAKILKHGAILFRGFNIESVASFEAFTQAICPDLFNENGEHPRRSLSGKVYTPVFYPADKHLLWHNENSFNARWPMKIWFCCLKPAEQGGETPIVDSRKVYDLIHPSIRNQFAQKQIKYVRNYGDGLGLDWRTVFNTSSKTEVENYCRKAEMQWEWKEGDRLRTSCVRPAVLSHPRTAEMVWFNQAQHWHISCLNSATRDSLLTLFSEEDLPRNCYYGDGSPIEASVMQEILAVYQRLEVKFAWEKGDVLMLDNMATAHARTPFIGDRKILVAMGEMASGNNNFAQGEKC